MDGYIKVDTQQLLKQAEVVSGLISNVSSSFSTLKNIIDGTNLYWIGEAGNSYREKYKSRESQFEEAIRRLNENVTDLRTMAGVYSTAEVESKKQAESLISAVIE